MMTAHRCSAPGCGRFVRAGASHCTRHDRIGSKADRGDSAEEPGISFRERLERGKYTELFDEQLRRVISEAATAASEEGLVEEIGALRVVLAKLLDEEKDPSKLAASVARVASVAVQATRTQRAISGDAAEGLTSALTQILTELDEG